MLSMARVCWRSPSPCLAFVIWPVLQSGVYRGMVSLPARDYQGLAARGCHPAAVLPESVLALLRGPGDRGRPGAPCAEVPGWSQRCWGSPGHHGEGELCLLLGSSARLGQQEDNAFGGIAFHFVLEEIISGLRTQAQAKTSAHTLHPSLLTTNDRIPLTKG